MLNGEPRSYQDFPNHMIVKSYEEHRFVFRGSNIVYNGELSDKKKEIIIGISRGERSPQKITGLVVKPS